MTRVTGRRRVQRRAVLVVMATGLLAACSGGGTTSAGPTPPPTAATSTASGQPAPSSGVPTGKVSQLAAWGDSLTAGEGGDGTTYPDVLSQLSGVPVFNGGVPGERSGGVAAREDGAPALLTAKGGSIPAQGGVQVTLANNVVVIRDTGELPGTLMGIHGVLTKDQTTNFGKYTFTRDQAGQQTQVPPDSPFMTDVGVKYRDAGVLIWAGHNDFRFGGADEVVKNIAAMVKYLNTENYLVLGLTNGTNNGRGTPYYDQAMGIVNTSLAKTYGPDHYLDVRTWLIKDGLAAAGQQATSQDQTDIAADIVPTSLRDPKAIGHLNSEGYTVLAGYIHDFLHQQGWF